MKLMVSHNAGSNYGEEGTGSIEQLQAIAKELALDERGLRWVIESDDGQEIVEVSAVHQSILKFMERIRADE